MARYRIRIADTGILGKTSHINNDFEALDDNAALEIYRKESESCRNFNKIEYGYMRVDGLFRIDQSESTTRIQ